MTSVLAIVPLFSFVAHSFTDIPSPLFFHSSVPSLFIVRGKECYLRYHSVPLFFFIYMRVLFRRGSPLSSVFDCPFSFSSSGHSPSPSCRQGLARERAHIWCRDSGFPSSTTDGKILSAYSFGYFHDGCLCLLTITNVLLDGVFTHFHSRLFIKTQ